MRRVRVHVDAGHRRAAMAMSALCQPPKSRAQSAVFLSYFKNRELHLRHGIIRAKSNTIQMEFKIKRSSTTTLSAVASASVAFRWIKNRRRWRDAMKKFLLATVGLVALGMAAPASAADLAARPYKAPPPVVADLRLERLLHRRQWRRRLEPQMLGRHELPYTQVAALPKVATMRQAEWLAVRLDTVGRARLGVRSGSAGRLG